MKISNKTKPKGALVKLPFLPSKFCTYLIPINVSPHWLCFAYENTAWDSVKQTVYWRRIPSAAAPLSTMPGAVLKKKIRLIWRVLQRDRVNSLLSSEYLEVFLSAPRSPLELSTGLVSPSVLVRHLLLPPLCSKTTMNRVSTPSVSNITYSEHIFFIWREA